MWKEFSRRGILKEVCGASGFQDKKINSWQIILTRSQLFIRPMKRKSVSFYGS
jgi:hypothetical protein